MTVLDRVNQPSDIKKLTEEEIKVLCEEIRHLIIEVISKNGGHLAPNLGVVELTLALHKIFDLPKDKIVWDVGHQAYIHKIITGRKEAFKTIRQYGGLSGFPKRQESPCDAFGTGHSSTSISGALGYACARDLAGEDYNVIAVIGDGALTGGEAMEALNNAGSMQKKIIVVLNDNEMSISKNVGALSEYLSTIRTDPTYSRVKGEVEGVLKGIPSIGTELAKGVMRLKDSLKYFLVPGMFFEDLGFTYLGPIDGHDMVALKDIFNKAKAINGPVFVHVITQKGRGYKPAEESPNKYHGTGPFEIATGKKLVKEGTPQTYTEVFGKALVELGATKKNLVAITAAMPDGTGLTPFAKAFPKRFFDVAIAEQHAVTMAAGMACNGLKPVVAIYSTFMQRAFDQILHDVCIQNLPVVIALDRAGLVGDDGYTHHGVFDYSYLRLMPNMTIMAPKDENELRHMLATAVNHNGPISLRYPRGAGIGVDTTEPITTFPLGKGERLSSGSDVMLWAVGSMVEIAQGAAKELNENGISAGVINARFVKPVDIELLKEVAAETNLLVTLEENTVVGGAGEGVLVAANSLGLLPKLTVITLGIPDSFVQQGSKAQLFKDLELDSAGVAKVIRQKLGKE